MFVSQGLVDPKVSHKLSWSKGKQVNIPAPSLDAMGGRIAESRPGVGSPGS